MTKVQKIWLSVFLAMFLVPEILWGPLLGLLSNFGGNILFPVFKNSQYVENNAAVMNLILISELVGMIGIGVINFKYFKSNSVVKFASGTLIILITVYLIFATYLFNSLDSFFS